MFRASKLALILASLATAVPAFAAEQAAQVGVSPKAAVLFDLGHGIHLTNSIVTGWAISLFLIILIMVLVGKATILPNRGQAVVESLLEGLREVLEPIVGKRAFPASFPILICLFIFILINNWMGLIPGVGSIGWGHDVDGRFEVVRPLIRPFASDFNSTIALAAVSFGAWLIIVLKFAGPKLIIKDLFGNKADRSETPTFLYVALSVIFVLVGFIELFSIAIRPFTLSVRLFGNVFGGENLLHGTHFLFVFYFMEALVGLIQAFVFTLLSAVYIGLLCNHGDDHAEDGHAAQH
jgi:F-type H+-transporting ATPase subunit a